MKNTFFLVCFLSLSAVIQAQPHCFIVGPAMNIGNTTITNYSFTRTTIFDNNGSPENVFTNLGDATNKATSAGIYMDLYKKKSRFAMDLMLPLKGSAANWFNLNWAWGGYIKEKVGILAGIGLYANSKVFSAVPTDPTATLISLSGEAANINPISYYSNNNLSGCGGVDLLVTYALKENVVFRIDYGIYLGDIVPNKTTVPDSYNWKGKSTKLELGAVWQFSDYLGLAVKFTKWKTVGNYTGDYSYTDPMNSGATLEKEVNLFPERTISSSNFMFSIMIPLGSAESQSGTIEVTPVN